MTVPHRPGPLSGSHIVEFGNLVAAPYCGMLLSDLGAEVTKVEPTSGDLAREIGPYQNGESAFFMAINRGKRSVAVDPKDPSVAAALFELCRRSDVVVNNLRRGAMERMGLGHDSLRSAAPELLYAVISAFGTTGPDADRPGIDLVFQGESGMMSLAGSEGDGPHKTATTIADFVAGTNAALAISACLADAEGGGRLIEVSLRDGLIAVQAGWNAQYFAGGRQPPRTGTASPVTGPNQTFATADGYVNVAVVSDRHFRDLCRVLGLEGLASDPGYRNNELRVANREVLASVLGGVLLTQSTAHWMSKLGAAGLPVGRIMALPEVFSDLQVLHNEMMVEFDHPVAGMVRTQGSPLRLDGAPARSQTHAPVLGQHTQEVLASLGFTRQGIAELANAGLARLGGHP
ncbi:MAG: CaiB/BaiF CoA transferase family protein [Actinomycetota bacterium]